MTNQELFDTVVNHLVAQGRPAMDNSSGDCFYRDGLGRKCAIGCLIPDDKYHTGMEGRAVISCPDVAGAAGLALDQLDLARALQTVHDVWDPGEDGASDANDRLSLCATMYGLNRGTQQLPIWEECNA